MFNEMQVKGFDAKRGIKNGDLILFKFPLGQRYRVFLVTGSIGSEVFQCKIKNCDIKVFEYDKICDMMKFDTFVDKLSISDINEDLYVHIYKDHITGTFKNMYQADDEVYDIFDPNDGGGHAVRYLTVLEASGTKLKVTEMISKKNTFIFIPEDENKVFFSKYEYAENFLESYKKVFENK